MTFVCKITESNGKEDQDEWKKVAWHVLVFDLLNQFKITDQYAATFPLYCWLSARVRLHFQCSPFRGLVEGQKGKGRSRADAKEGQERIVFMRFLWVCKILDSEAPGWAALDIYSGLRQRLLGKRKRKRIGRRSDTQSLVFRGAGRTAFHLAFDCVRSLMSMGSESSTQFTICCFPAHTVPLCSHAAWMVQAGWFLESS